MDQRIVKSALLMTLAASVSGCSRSNDSDFVNFRQTSPSRLDQQTALKDAERDESANLGASPTPVQGSLPVPSIAVVTDSVDSAVPPADGSLVSKVEPDSSTTIQTVSVNTPGSDVASPPVDANRQAAVSGNVVVSAQSGLTGLADNPIVENAGPAEPRPIELLIPVKHFRKERGTSAVRVTYDDIDLLKVLNMEPVPVDAAEHFPDWLKSLDGKPIRIRGFMFPTFEMTGLTSFTMARDNGICCFVRQPKIYDIIGVKLGDGITTNSIEGRPFDVEGIFRIEPEADEHDLARLYRIENAKVVGSP